MHPPRGESPAAPYLDSLELASGLVLGAGERRSRSSTAATPLEALEEAIRPALLRQPCLVSFSGGRDSSALLAVAADLARREGHPLPVPVTNRFPGAPAADESVWQERVVSHLRLDDWIRLEHGENLDCVGDVATETALRHGLLWPCNAYFHVPLFGPAKGGSLVTGLGGDEMLEGSAWSYLRHMGRRRRRPTARDVARAGFAVSPRPVRHAVLRRHVPEVFSWLTPAARDSVGRRLARHAASEPVRWRAHVAWRRRHRYLDVAEESLGLLADDADASLHHPFLEAGFVDAVASLDARRRFPSRTAAMRGLFSGLLPDDLLTRESKGSFDEVFWTDNARAYAAHWSGDGVDEALVDPDALRAEWQSDRPDARSFLLAQAVWLAEHAVVSPKPPGGVTPLRRGSPGSEGA